MKAKTICLIVCISVMCEVALVAQQSKNKPARKLLQITRDRIKPWKEAKHTELEIEAAKACAKHNSPVHFLAISSVTGPSEVWWLIWHDSYASLDALAIEYFKNSSLANELARICEPKAELISYTDSFFCEYREDLSQGPEVDLAHRRFFSISFQRVNPGHTEEYEEIQRIARTLHDRVGTPGYSVYQVVTGGADDTFLVFTPLNSLKDMGDAAKPHWVDDDLASGAQNQTKLNELVSAAIKSSENYLFSISPPMSYPARDWVTADPEFWAVKPAGK